MSERKRNRRILYIAGYSRSGSTILDMVLNAHAQIASAGELTFLHEDADTLTLKCGCGAPYRSCPVYGPWLQNRPDGEGGCVRSVEKRGNLRRLLSGRTEPGVKEGYARYANGLFDHLHDTLDAEVIVDSSKSARDAAGRPFALQHLAGRDVRVLHLTRDPRMTLQSFQKTGSNWVLEGRRAARPLDAWRPVLGWTLANGIAARMRSHVSESKYLHMRFEAFQADPAAALSAIGALLELDLSGVVQKIRNDESFLAGHNVGGNRTRLQPQRISLEKPPAPHLSPAQELSLGLVAGRLRKTLGYD